MDVRERIERRDVGLEELREGVAGDEDEDRDAGAATDEALVEALFDRLVDEDVDVSDGERAYLREAFERLADGEWDAAAEVLRERYESVCETHSPEDPRAACHLRGLPTDVDLDEVDRVEVRGPAREDG